MARDLQHRRPPSRRTRQDPHNPVPAPIHHPPRRRPHDNQLETSPHPTRRRPPRTEHPLPAYTKQLTRSSPLTTRPTKGPDTRPDPARSQGRRAQSRLWVADMTYVCTRGGFVYTAFITDVFPARSSAAPPKPPLTTKGVTSRSPSLGARPVQKGTPLRPWSTTATRPHSYLSIAYTSTLKDYTITTSTGSVGDSLDNALAETVGGLVRDRTHLPPGSMDQPRPRRTPPPPKGPTGTTRSVSTTPQSSLEHRNGTKPRTLQGLTVGHEHGNRAATSLIGWPRSTTNWATRNQTRRVKAAFE